MPNATLPAENNVDTTTPASKKKGKKKVSQSLEAAVDINAGKQDGLKNGAGPEKNGSETGSEVKPETPVGTADKDNSTTDENKNPYLEVINKRLRSFKKRQDKILKIEEMDKNLLNPDQLTALQKKGELQFAIEEFEAAKKNIIKVESEEIENQKRQKKVLEDEREDAIAKAVKESEAAYENSILHLLQFFRLVHFQNVGIVQLNENESAEIDHFKGLLLNLAGNALQEETRQEKIDEIMMHILKLDRGDEDVINRPLANGIVEQEDQTAHELIDEGLSYSQIRSLILSPPIAEITEETTNSIESNPPEIIKSENVLMNYEYLQPHQENNDDEGYTFINAPRSFPTGKISFMANENFVESSDAYDEYQANQMPSTQNGDYNAYNSVANEPQFLHAPEQEQQHLRVQDQAIEQEVVVESTQNQIISTLIETQVVATAAAVMPMDQQQPQKVHEHQQGVAQQAAVDGQTQNALDATTKGGERYQKRDVGHSNKRRGRGQQPPRGGNANNQDQQNLDPTLANEPTQRRPAARRPKKKPSMGAHHNNPTPAEGSQQQSLINNHNVNTNNGDTQPPQNPKNLNPSQPQGQEENPQQKHPDNQQGPSNNYNNFRGQNHFRSPRGTRGGFRGFRGRGGGSGGSRGPRNAPGSGPRPYSTQ